MVLLSKIHYYSLSYITWGADQGMHTKEDIHNLISLIWAVYPQSLLSIALKEMSLEMHPDSTKIPPIVYVFNLTCGKMCPVNSESIAML